jgi:hypothetical protein
LGDCLSNQRLQQEGTPCGMTLAAEVPRMNHARSAEVIHFPDFTPLCVMDTVRISNPHYLPYIFFTVDMQLGMSIIRRTNEEYLKSKKTDYSIKRRKTEKIT